MERGRTKKAPERFIDIREHANCNSRALEVSDDDASHLSMTPPSEVPLPCLPVTGPMPSTPTSSISAHHSNSKCSRSQTPHLDNDFDGHTRKLDDVVARRGHIPGTDGATYFLVRQLFRRVVSLEAEVRELRLQLASSATMSSTSTSSRNSRGFCVPVTQEQGEVGEVIKKLDDRGFRSDLVSFRILFCNPYIKPSIICV